MASDDAGAGGGDFSLKSVSVLERTKGVHGEARSSTVFTTEQGAGGQGSSKDEAWSKYRAPGTHASGVMMSRE
mgnify:CR=1 FL=1